MNRIRPTLNPVQLDGPYCRNCGALAEVSYCPVCGQETKIEMPTVGHFVAEFAEQTFALQGQLWRTLNSLLFKPGQLTLEYVAGRRQRYVRPLRLYLALSILFFAVIGVSIGSDFLQLDAEAQADLDQARAEINAADSEAAPAPPVDSAPNAVDPAAKVPSGAPPGASIGGMTINTGHPEFDARVKARVSELLALPKAEMTERLRDTFTAWAPVAMFFLMPLFAAFLKIGYLGRKANYAVHLLFAVNFHSFIFLALLLGQLPIIGTFSDLLIVVIPVYLWFALRRVHGGGWLSTAVFVLFLLVIYLIFLALVMAVSTLAPLAFL